MDQILKFFSSNENGTYNKNHKYGYSRYKTSPKMYRIVVFNILNLKRNYNVKVDSWMNNQNLELFKVEFWF